MNAPAQKVKPRLGRGLSSLISLADLPVQAEVVADPSAPPASPAPVTPEAAPAEAATPLPDDAPALRTLELPLDAIAPNPHQPRQHFDDAALAELAASIRATGVIQPVLIRPTETGYQLIAGERRLRAARLAGLATIPALVRPVDAVTQAQMALIENIQRQDLNPVDRAHGYRTLLQQLGLTQVELATRLGEQRSSIANYLRILELPEAVRGWIREGRLSVGHAKLLAGVSDVLEQQRLAELVISQDLSVRNLERMLQAGSSVSPANKKPSAPSAHIRDLEKTLTRHLGMKVSVRSAGKKGRGKLVIQYTSLDQFDQLMAQLGVRLE